MKRLAYQPAARGRSGVIRPTPERAPKVSLPTEAFTSEERPDGLHIVDTRTGHSFGIMASPAIAEDQLRALRRISLL